MAECPQNPDTKGLEGFSLGRVNQSAQFLPQKWTEPCLDGAGKLTAARGARKCALCIAMHGGGRHCWGCEDGGGEQR